MACEYITREQLRASTHCEIEDSIILGMCCDIAYTTVHMIIATWIHNQRGFVLKEMVEVFAKKLLRTGRISYEMRQFVIDIMCGQRPVFLDYSGKTSGLLAWQAQTFTL